MNSKHLLTIGLAWQRAESQVSQNYIAGCPIRNTKSLKVSSSYCKTVLIQHKKPIAPPPLNRIKITFSFHFPSIFGVNVAKFDNLAL